MRGFCWDESDHRRQAENDAHWHQRDRDYYDRYSDDPCKQVYVEAYDREIRAQERREEERQLEEAEERRAIRRREEEQSEQCWPEEQFPPEQWPDEPPPPEDTPNAR